MRVGPSGLAQPFPGIVHTIAHEYEHVRRLKEGIADRNTNEFLGEAIEILSEGMREEDLETLAPAAAGFVAGFANDADRALVNWNAMPLADQRTFRNRFIAVRQRVRDRIAAGTPAQQALHAPLLARLQRRCCAAPVNGARAVFVMRSKSGPTLVVSLGILAVVSICSGLRARPSERPNRSDHRNSIPEKERSAMKVLQIDVKILTEPVRLSGPCMIEVRITNKSPQSVVLNQRLAVGYKNSQSRELFLEVFEKGSKEVASREGLLYERVLPAPDDYVRVAPEQSIGRSFNLFEWYTLRTPGEYEVVVYYQADESLAQKPPELLEGTHSSERIPLTVMP